MNDTQNNYLFQLGKFPGLSATEFSSLLPSVEPKNHFKMFLSANLPDQQSAIDLFHYSAGFIRIVHLLHNSVQELSLVDVCTELLHDHLQDNTSKATIGFSCFRNEQHDNLNLAKLASRLKSSKQLKLNLRYVLPKENTTELSAAQVIRNNLTDSNSRLEICFIGNRDGTYAIGYSLDIQDIDWYSKRDSLRPERLRSLGMIPTKLAKTMVNLALADTSSDGFLILDPFCGSGTILQEALLRGCDSIGTDIEPIAVQASHQNLLWLSKQPEFPEGIQLESHSDILQIDATRLTTVFAPDSIDAIVTEGYLGPLFEKHPTTDQLDDVVAKLHQLYLLFLLQARTVLKPECKIIMSLPYWMQSNTSLFQILFDDIQQIGYTNLAFSDVLPDERITDRGSYLYSRSDHIVGREIIILQANVN